MLHKIVLQNMCFHLTIHFSIPHQGQRFRIFCRNVVHRQEIHHRTENPPSLLELFTTMAKLLSSIISIFKNLSADRCLSAFNLYLSILYHPVSEAILLLFLKQHTPPTVSTDAKMLIRLIRVQFILSATTSPSEARRWHLNALIRTATMSLSLNNLLLS